MTPKILGDLVEYFPEERSEPPVDSAYRVVHGDDDLLVLDKPPNLPCHPAGRFFRHTLWALLQRDGMAPPIRFVHRLDRETSGLVLVAKSATAARRLGEQFESGRVEKVCLVIVEGRAPEQFVAEGWLAPDPTSEVRKKLRLVEADAQRGTALPRVRTQFRRIGVTGSLSLLEARPATGRRHQIRASLCSLGLPVVGDKLYGVDESLYLRFIRDELSEADRTRLRIPRQALHATSLTVTHPGTGERAEFTSPTPDDMAALV